MVTDAKPLNDTQLMLLRLFSRQKSDKEVDEIREVLLGYYETALQKEVNSVVDIKGITKNDFEKILNKQFKSE